VESTNNYAMGLVRAGMAQHGLAVFTHEQIKGRGQRQKQWVSEGGKNIAISLVADASSLSHLPPFSLSMAVANAGVQFLQSYVFEDLTIKWPNDLYWRDRKAGGILIENVWQGKDWKWAVIGIGINVNQTDFGSLGNTAVSLKQITGRIFDPLQLARELCGFLQAEWEVLLRDPSLVRDRYNGHLYRRGELVKFRIDGELHEGRINTVNEQGQLVLGEAEEAFYDPGSIVWER